MFLLRWWSLSIGFLRTELESKVCFNSFCQFLVFCTGTDPRKALNFPCQKKITKFYSNNFCFWKKVFLGLLCGKVIKIEVILVFRKHLPLWRLSFWNLSLLLTWKERFLLGFLDTGCVDRSIFDEMILKTKLYTSRQLRRKITKILNCGHGEAPNSYLLLSGEGISHFNLTKQKSRPAFFGHLNVFSNLMVCPRSKN